MVGAVHGSPEPNSGVHDATDTGPSVVSITNPSQRCHNEGALRESPSVSDGDVQQHAVAVRLVVFGDASDPASELTKAGSKMIAGPGPPFLQARCGAVPPPPWSSRGARRGGDDVYEGALAS